MTTSTLREALFYAVTYRAGSARQSVTVSVKPPTVIEDKVKVIERRSPSPAGAYVTEHSPTAKKRLSKQVCIYHLKHMLGVIGKDGEVISCREPSKCERRRLVSLHDITLAEASTNNSHWNGDEQKIRDKCKEFKTETE